MRDSLSWSSAKITCPNNTVHPICFYIDLVSAMTVYSFQLASMFISLRCSIFGLEYLFASIRCSIANASFSYSCSRFQRVNFQHGQDLSVSYHLCEVIISSSTMLLQERYFYTASQMSSQLLGGQVKIVSSGYFHLKFKLRWVLTSASWPIRFLHLAPG